MNHNQYRDWMAVSDELGDDERRMLEAHLGNCPACRREFEELQYTVRLMGEHRAEPPSEALLSEARRGLQDALRREPDMGALRDRSSVRSLGPRLTGWLGWITGPRLALSGVAAVLIGFFAGYLAFGGSVDPVPPLPSEQRPAVTQTEQAMGGPSIANVRFLDLDPRSGEVEVQYDLVRPVRLRAGVDESRMQRMLAYALLNESNPGVRLEAISALNSAKPEATDNQVKQALIKSLMADPNPGVRKQALFVLYRMPFDTAIKNACLYALKNDENSGIRVACVNILAQATVDGAVEGQEVYDALRPEFSQDDYLRRRSGVFIHEVSQEEAVDVQ